MVASRFTTAAAALILSLAALPTPSHAQASREGPTFAAAGAWPGFSAATSRHRLRPGQQRVPGGLGSDDARPLRRPPTAFPSGRTSSTSHRAAPTTRRQRVAYGDGKFLVTWLDVRNDPRGNIAWVYGRLLELRRRRHAGLRTGPDFLIGAAVAGVNPERAAAVAYSTVSKRFLVAYHQDGGGAVPVQRHSRPARVLDRPAGRSRRSPSRSTTTSRARSGIGYSPASDKFLVAYRHFYEPAGPATIQSRTVSAVDGALGAAADMTASNNTNVPEVAYNTKTNQFLLSWWQGEPRCGRHLLRASREPGRCGRGARHADDRELRRLRLARHRLQRARRHLLRRGPRPRPVDVPAGRRWRGDVRHGPAERRVRRHRHRQQDWQLLSRASRPVPRATSG